MKSVKKNIYDKWNFLPENLLFSRRWNFVNSIDSIDIEEIEFFLEDFFTRVSSHISSLGN